MLLNWNDIETFIFIRYHCSVPMGIVMAMRIYVSREHDVFSYYYNVIC